MKTIAEMPSTPATPPVITAVLSGLEGGQSIGPPDNGRTASRDVAKEVAKETDSLDVLAWMGEPRNHGDKGRSGYSGSDSRSSCS